MENQLNILARVLADNTSGIEQSGIVQAQVQGCDVPPASFTRYLKLAAELRVSIVRATIVPRIIEIVEGPIHLPPVMRSLCCAPADFQGLSGADRLTHEILFETHKYKFHSFMEDGWPVLINKETDIICFDSLEALYRFATTPDATKLLRDELLTSIAVRYDAYESSYYTIAGNYMHDMELFDALMRAIRGFGSLRKLYIVQGEYPAGREQEAVTKMNDLRSYAQNHVAFEKRSWDEIWYEIERMNHLPVGHSYRWRVPEIVVIREDEFKRQFKDGELDL
ncbi:hypothetical protein BKA64DRAFT_640159 [Cadophora sp. MPI-SDFR-AT-0126]|nr:hypothetical protein BKA64DRAFT_640159 [Leotiomycetes sp. MPI-SDFR-AT-0126]